MPRRFFGKTDEDDVENNEAVSEAEQLDGQQHQEDDSNQQEPAEQDKQELSELELAQIDAAESKDKYIRLVAELENVKKRNAKERSELLRYSGEHIVQDLLDVVDNLQRAVQHSETASAEEILKGVKMIADEFVSVLERQGVVAKDAVGQVFDPKEHEALASVPTPDHPAGVVIEQLKKAYYMRDKLLRPAQVVVAAEMPKAAEPVVADSSEVEEDEAQVVAPLSPDED